MGMCEIVGGFDVCCCGCCWDEFCFVECCFCEIVVGVIGEVDGEVFMFSVFCMFEDGWCGLLCEWVDVVVFLFVELVY